MFRIAKAVVYDLVRNWSLWLYVAFLMLTCVGLFTIESHPDKSVIGVLKVVLFLVPSFSLIFSVIYYFNSTDFIGILLVQPIKRSTIILSFIVSLSFIFAAIACMGAGIPLLIFAPGLASLTVILTGVLLSVIFVSLGILIAVSSREKSHGLGVSLVLLFYFTLLFDGLVLLLIYMLSDYPIEKYSLYVTFLNPLDLSRIMTLMHTDAAAMMGYTGAVFRQFFTAGTGMIVSICILILWFVIPSAISVRKFVRKKF